MENIRDNNVWLSAYIFFNGDIYSENCDLIISEIIEPFIRLCERNKWIRKHFFIRYSEEGSHVRIRLESKANQEIIINELEKYLAMNYLIERNTKITNNPKNKKILKWIPYEPEVERYGGENAIFIAQEFFYYSSETVYSILKENNKIEEDDRLRFGLMAMVILVNIFYENKKNAQIFFNKYHTGYLDKIVSENGAKVVYVEAFREGLESQSIEIKEFVEGLWNVLICKGELPCSWNYYRNKCITIKTALMKIYANSIENDLKDNYNELIKWVLPSYMHMMNNRLGISIMHESYLAYLINNSM